MSGIWVDGKRADNADAAISAEDRSFLLGDGCFETLFFDGEDIEGVSFHLASLQRSADALGIVGAPSSDLISAALEEAARELRSAAAPSVLRITLSRGAGGRGPSTGHVAPTWIVATARLSAARPFPPLRLSISSIRRNETSPLSRIKSTSYGDNLAARREAERAGCNDALMLNTLGDVAGLAMGNLALLREGDTGDEIVTPPETSGARAGYMRDRLFEAAHELGFSVRECVLRTEDLYASQAAWGLNSLWGVRPAIELDQRPLTQSEDVTQRLHAKLADLIKRERGA
ncbi:MAG: aminotransferase class IV [Pseudomonadota bacterium]